MRRPKTGCKSTGWRDERYPPQLPDLYLAEARHAQAIKAFLSVDAFATRRFRAWEGYLLYFLAGWAAFVFAVAVFKKVVKEVLVEGVPIYHDLFIMRLVHQLA